MSGHINSYTGCLRNNRAFGALCQNNRLPGKGFGEGQFSYRKWPGLIRQQLNFFRILCAQQNPSLYHIYIDAFAGSGKHRSKNTGEFVLGSPLNAIQIEIPFKEYHFIDLNKQKIKSLETLAGSRQNVYIYNEDCNQVLLNEIIPKVRYENYQRALCVLDPYGLHLDWQVIFNIGQTKTFDIFLNFPVSDMNRNVLWRSIESVSIKQIERMNRFWGDNS